MNCILVNPDDFIADSRVRLTGRRYEHIKRIHRAKIGKQLRIGLIQGMMGAGVIDKMSESALEMKVILDQQPPEPLPAIVILALPRPKTFRKVLHIISSMGVKKLYIIRSWRVEKSYWNSPALHRDSIHEQLLLGLEQACDTIVPHVFFRPLFKPFVEDELPGIIDGTLGLIAHPDSTAPPPYRTDTPVTLIIGPEGGFIEYELTALGRSGARRISLGPRILRVEIALPTLLGKLF